MDQRPDRGPVTLREIGAEFSAEYLQWDRGLPGTFRAVTQRAAEVARAYLERRGDRFVRPLRYLLLSIVASVSVSWLVYERLGLPQGTDAEAARQVPFLIEHAALLTLAVLPLVALVMRGAFHGLGVRYVDALVLLAYTQAQANWFGVLGPLLLLAGAPQGVVVALGVAVAGWLLWSWASFGVGPAWRRWVAAASSLLLGQALNGGIVFGVLGAWRLVRD